MATQLGLARHFCQGTRLSKPHQLLLQLSFSPPCNSRSLRCSCRSLRSCRSCPAPSARDTQCMSADTSEFLLSSLLLLPASALHSLLPTPCFLFLRLVPSASLLVLPSYRISLLERCVPAQVPSRPLEPSNKAVGAARMLQRQSCHLSFSLACDGLCISPDASRTTRVNLGSSTVGSRVAVALV